MSASYPIVRCGVRCRCPDLDAHRRPPGWFAQTSKNVFIQHRMRPGYNTECAQANKPELGMVSWHPKTSAFSAHARKSKNHQQHLDALRVGASLVPQHLAIETVENEMDELTTEKLRQYLAEQAKELGIDWMIAS